MYMDFDFNTDDLVFTTDKEGNLKGGGFKINSDFLKNTIETNKDESQSGGGKGKSIDAILNSLKDLAVPVGLYHTKSNTQNTNKNIRYEYKESEVDETIYDKLLELVDPEKRKLHGRKTRSKREKTKKNTRKIKH